MKAMEKTISFILQIIVLSTVHVNSKPCSKSNSECKPVRMPLISNQLKAPLVAELDITSVNKQLESYINDDIESTFSEKIQDMVKNEQDQTKTSMLEDYSLKLNTTQMVYDKRFLNIVQNLEAKQKEITFELLEVYKNLSESETTFNAAITDSLNGFEHRQESLKLAMMSEYLSKLQQSQDANNRKFNDLASDLKSHFANLSHELKKEFKKSTTDLQVERQELGDWKTNLMKTLKDTFAPITKNKDCSYMTGEKNKLSGVYYIYPDEIHGKKTYCDMATDGGGWTVLQRRIDRTTSFDRNWKEYKEGFGDPQKEYWLGNKYLNILTSKDKYELRVDLTDINNKHTYALFKTFIVGDENSKYKLTIGEYSGTADLIKKKPIQPMCQPMRTNNKYQEFIHRLKVKGGQATPYSFKVPVWNARPNFFDQTRRYPDITTIKFEPYKKLYKNIAEDCRDDDITMRSKLPQIMC